MPPHKIPLSLALIILAFHLPSLTDSKERDLADRSFAPDLAETLRRSSDTAARRQTDTAAHGQPLTASWGDRSLSGSPNLKKYLTRTKAKDATDIKASKPASGSRINTPLSAPGKTSRKIPKTAVFGDIPDPRVPKKAKMSCIFWDRCERGEQDCTPKMVEKDCGPLGSDYCYSVWSNDTHTQNISILHMDCWPNMDALPERCSRGPKCVSEFPKSPPSKSGGSNIYFCCCSEPLCNKNYTYIPARVTDKPGVTGPSVGEDKLQYVFLALAPVVFIALITVIAFYCYRKKKQNQGRGGGGHNLAALGSSFDPATGKFLTAGSDSDKAVPLMRHGCVKLIEVKAKGRFGVIYRASFSEGGQSQEVAVKHFPAVDMDSWAKEQEIYSVPALRGNPHILQYFGADVRGCLTDGADGRTDNREFWLITAYHHNGSLYDYLKMHTLSIGEAFQISVGMLKGLAFLHEELHTSGSAYKPTIVHRDFKSKNLLIKNDLTPCIADFGLALKCEHGQTPEETHGQVGTRRYMAPEVLEGATEFSAFAFRQIDVYAAALVLWEIASRAAIGEEPVLEHRLPFEREVGCQPTLQEMQHCVLTLRTRPALRDVWSSLYATSVLSMTMEQMWDSEPEARLTAGCAQERLQAVLTTDVFVTQDSGIETEPLIYRPAAGLHRSHPASPASTPLHDSPRIEEDVC